MSLPSWLRVECDDQLRLHLATINPLSWGAYKLMYGQGSPAVRAAEIRQLIQETASTEPSSSTSRLGNPTEEDLDYLRPTPSQTSKRSLHVSNFAEDGSLGLPVPGSLDYDSFS